MAAGVEVGANDLSFADEYRIFQETVYNYTISPYIHKTASELDKKRADFVRSYLIQPWILKFWKIVPDGSVFKLFRGQPISNLNSSYSPIFSTSSSPYIALRFAKLAEEIKGREKHCCLFEIRVQPGIRYIDVDSVLGQGKTYNEKEIILEGGQNLTKIGEEQIRRPYGYVRKIIYEYSRKDPLDPAVYSMTFLIDQTLKNNPNILKGPSISFKNYLFSNNRPIGYKSKRNNYSDEYKILSDGKTKQERKDYPELIEFLDDIYDFESVSNNNTYNDVNNSNTNKNMNRYKYGSTRKKRKIIKK
jgi:hypothetical protein